MPFRRIALPLAAVLVAAVACGSSGGQAAPPAAPVRTTAAAPTTPAPAPPTTAPPTTAPPSPRPTTDPGLLPQTRRSPTAADPRFTAGVRALWSAAVAGYPPRALPFFFPLSAYRQVKAISDPAADWRTRLVGFYAKDILAIHATLGTGARRARLTGVDVPAAAGGWVEPGAEYNRIGYYRVYGTRVHYELDGQARSFGICSLISWRGQWYAVHLGPITRQGQGGQLCNE